MAEDVDRGGGVQTVRVALIDPSARNPRRKLADVAALAASVAAYGLLQPLVVRPRGERYELMAGHRRLAAVQQLGWETVPAVVRAASEDEAYMLTLVENLQRSDLSPREEADALAELLRSRQWTARQVAEAIQRSPAYVSKRLRVFEDAALAPAVLLGRLSLAVAEELLVVPAARRPEVVERAVAEQWDYRQARAVARGPRAAGKAARRAGALARAATALREQLRDVDPRGLSEKERRALRLLFADLALIARAPNAAEAPRQQPIIPSLPAA